MAMRRSVTEPKRTCAVRDVLDHISDQWSLLVLLRLEPGTLRFSQLRREVGEISQLG